MGARKRKAAEARKEAMKDVALARLRNVPTSPQRMREVADLIRGEDVDKALSILQFTKRHAAKDLYKLVRSAIANWEAKNEGKRAEDSNLYIKSIQVDVARTLRRIRPAPQGRAYRIRKRSNHVTVVLDSMTDTATAE
jgi:large subunit ribosomal protein L22